MSDEIKIRLVSTHDDSGYKAATANARKFSKDVGSSVKDVIKQTGNATKAVTDEAQKSLDTMKNSAGAANVAMNAAQGNIIGATNAVVEMGARCNVLKSILEKIGSVRLGIIGVIVAAVMALKSAFDSMIEAADKAVHESRMRKYEQWGKLIETISANWKDVEASINRSNAAQARWASNARDLEDARMELQKAKEIREAGGDRSKISAIESRYSERASANAYDRALDDQRAKRDKIKEELENIDKARRQLARASKEIELDIHGAELDLSSAKSGGDEEEIQRAEEAVNKLYEIRSKRNAEGKALSAKTTELWNSDLEATNQIAHIKRMRRVELEMEAEARKSKADEDARALAEKQAQERKALMEKTKKENEEREKQVKAENEKKLKAAEELEKQKQQLEKETRAKALQESLKNYRTELKERQVLASSAQSRLAQAQNASAQAWGWYRDKSKLKSVLKEEADNAKAEIQFQREFERLKSFRYDWRTANAYGSGKMHSLSLEEEAVRRVALAREEEAEAKKAVIESRDAVVWIQEHLEKIEGMKE